MMSESTRELHTASGLEGTSQAEGWLRALWGVPRGPWARLTASYVAIYLLVRMVLGPTELGEAIGLLAFVPLSFGVSLAFWVAARAASERRFRRGFGFFAGAFAATTVGTVIWCWEKLVLHVDPTFSWSNFPYLLSYPLTIAGVAAFPLRRPGVGERWKLVLDGAIAVVAGVAITWLRVIMPLAGSDSDPVHQLLLIAYPIGDLVVFAILVPLLLTPREPGRGRVLQLLALGQALYLAGDIGYQLGGTTVEWLRLEWPDLLFVAGYVVMIWAAEAFRRLPSASGAEAQSQVPAVARNLVPLLLGIVVYAFLFAEAVSRWMPGYSVLALAAVLVTALLLGREALTEQENVRLARALEARRGEQRFQNVIRHLRVGVLVQGPGAELLLGNQAAQELLGLTEAELLGRTSFDPAWNVIHDDGSPFPGETHPVPVAIATGKPVRHVVMGVFRPRTGDRVWLLVDAEPELDARGKVERVICTFHDITAIRAARVELAAREARYRLLFEANPEAMWVHDPMTLRFLAVNNAAIERYGYSREEFLGMSLTDLEVGGLAPARESPMGGGAGRLEHLPLRQRRKDGAVLDVELTVDAIEFDGRPARMALARDVTEQRQLEVQLRQAQRMEAVGQLAGGVAHDFNNLLTAITGCTTLLLDSLGPNDPRIEEVQEISRAAQRAADLTRQLLAFGRRQLLQPVVLDLNDTVRDAGKLLRRLLGENIRIETGLAPDLGRVRADRGQLEQVLLNLAVNARDAMPHGGTLLIQTRNVAPEDPDLRIRPEPGAAGYVLLRVSDSGVGIDEATRGRIFEPFFTTKEVGKGTGLGLSTVYGIVKQSGGEIWVDSEVGRGTTFTICLPRTEAGEPKGVDAPARPASLATGHETVLVVEDEASLRRVTRRTLESRGYAVLEAGGAEEALAILQSRGAPVDLLVTDVVMPGGNGAELAVQARGLFPGLPVLFISGYADEETLRHGVDQAEAVLLSKPFSADDLVLRVRKLLDARAGADPPLSRSK
jgi:PAS domain S-box-containing protein